MHSMALRITNSWLNDAGEHVAGRYMLKADRQADGWKFQVLLYMTDQWVNVDLPVMPGTLHVNHVTIGVHVVDNLVEIEFSDYQHQYTLKIGRHLLTIERFNRGDLTHSVWYIANLVDAHIDIG